MKIVKIPGHNKTYFINLQEYPVVTAFEDEFGKRYVRFVSKDPDNIILIEVSDYVYLNIDSYILSEVKK